MWCFNVSFNLSTDISSIMSSWFGIKLLVFRMSINVSLVPFSQTSLLGMLLSYILRYLDLLLIRFRSLGVSCRIQAASLVSSNCFKSLATFSTAKYGYVTSTESVKVKWLPLNDCLSMWSVKKPHSLHWFPSVSVRTIDIFKDERFYGRPSQLPPKCCLTSKQIKGGVV